MTDAAYSLLGQFVVERYEALKLINRMLDNNYLIHNTPDDLKKLRAILEGCTP